MNPQKLTTPNMLTRHYTLRFVTPAFLGNAEQDGQWRTPPIKALLRQWWRVAYAADQPNAVDIAAMRRAEGQLFGVAADREGESRQSRLRLRLSHWDRGRLKSWDGLEQRPVHHREVEQTKHLVGPHLYLGFGPLGVMTGRTVLKRAAAIQHGEVATLRLAFPDDAEASRLRRSLWLLHHYGTLGGRSRNGWGSFSLSPADPGTPVFAAGLDPQLTLPWRDALAQDWPRAIGTDARGPLVWQTEALPDWMAVMRRLAEVKIGLRTQRAFTFHSGPGAAAPEARHWLSYPVSKHSVRDWERENARLPNSLRFKVRTAADGRLHGVVFHLPCHPPTEPFHSDKATLLNVWQQVHQYLDNEARLPRIPA